MTRYRKLVKKRNTRYKKYKTYRRNRHKAGTGTFSKKIKKLLSGRTKIHPENPKIKIIQHLPPSKTATADELRLLTTPQQYFPTLNDVTPPPSYKEFVERSKINDQQALANAKLDEAIRKAIAQDEAEDNDAANEGQRDANGDRIWHTI
jgi:hypothetical protein